MHINPVKESDGVSSPWKPVENPNFKCRCGSNQVEYMIWESNCGGYEDEKFHCKTCNKTWWVEGADS